MSFVRSVLMSRASWKPFFADMSLKWVKQGRVTTGESHRERNEGREERGGREGKERKEDRGEREGREGGAECVS